MKNDEQPQQVCISGHWEAFMFNSWRREDNRQWGNFKTKQEALLDAEWLYSKEISPDSTLEIGAKYVFDLDGEELLEALLSQGLVDYKTVSERIEGNPEVALPPTEWQPYTRVLSYRAKQVVDPATDPDCRRAWRNGHNGIDLEYQKSVGHQPIFATRNGLREVIAGDWLVQWADNENHTWVESHQQAVKLLQLSTTSQVDKPKETP